MPKQVLKIDKFHGGINNESDPRDIADNQLVKAEDISVSEVGRIVTGDKNARHVSHVSSTQTSEPGYGLFKFSHDRLGANYVNRNCLDTDGTFTINTGWTDNGTSFTYAYNASGGDLTQTSSNLHNTLVASKRYAFIYTISSLTSTASMAAQLHTTTASVVTPLTLTAGTHILEFTSASSPTDFQIDVNNVGTAGDTFIISNMELILIDDGGDDYLMLADADSGGTISIYSKEFDTWENVITGRTDVTGGNRKEVFSVVDGAVRICDSNFQNSNDNKWYGWIDSRHWMAKGTNSLYHEPLGYSHIFKGFYLKDTKLAPPTQGVVGYDVYSSGELATSGTADGGDGNTLQANNAFTSTYFDHNLVTDGMKGYYGFNDTQNELHLITDQTSGTLASKVDFATSLSSGTWSGDAYAIYPAPGAGFNLEVTKSGSGSSWPTAEWEFASTFIYQGNQESNLYNLRGYAITSSGENVYIKIMCQAAFDPLIIGGRIYLRERNTSDDWLMLVDISLEHGARVNLSGDHQGWEYGHDGTLGIMTVGTLLIEDPGSPFSYESLSSNSQSKEYSSIKYKTSVVTNRKMYVGNIEYTNNETGNTELHGDMVIKSNINQFDSFSLDNSIEATVNDGDEIVKLEEYADRILEFKKGKLHIINISQDIEFLEDTLHYRGVSHPTAVCKTPQGIAWVNAHGVFFYDGQKIHDLFVQNGVRRISQSSWTSQLTVTADSAGTVTKEVVVASLTAGQETHADPDPIYISTAKKPINSASHIYLYYGGSETALAATTGLSGDYVLTHTIIDENHGILDSVNFKGTIDYVSGAIEGKIYLAAAAEGDAIKLTYTHLETTATQLNPMIGYNAIKDKLIIFSSVTTNDNTEPMGIEYDFKTQSFVYIGHSGGSEIDDVKSNFVNDWDGYLVWHNDSNNEINYITTERNTGSDLQIITKDFDFGDPSRRKKIYKVYISFKGDADSINVRYSTDGDTDTLGTFYQIAADGSSTNATATNTPLLDDNDTTKWINAELKPSSSINNVYSFQLHFDGTMGSDCEINDISIVYRMKGIK